MNQKLLIILGIIIIPFYEILLRMLPFVVSIAPDSRAPKEIIALIFALSIGLLAVFQGTIKSFKNKWLLAIPVYLLFNLINSPHADLFINGVESGDLYFWKSFSEILCFSLMIIAVSSIEIKFDSIINIMVVCGLGMSIYVILQKFGFDQFWIARTEQNFISVRSEALGGNLGQPTIVASFIAMLVPLSFYVRKYFISFIMVSAVLLTQSAMAIMSLLFVLLICLIKFNKIFIYLFLLIGLLAGGYILSSHQTQLKIIDRMDGRVEAWSNVYKDIKNGAIDNTHSLAFTGVGLGRFSYIFPMKNKSQFRQAHNDLLEFTYDCGFIGLILLVIGLWMMSKNIFQYPHGIGFSVFLSFMALLFCSLGSFPFQLGAHQFYASLLVGILNNDSIIKGGIKC